jgi:glycosyltransferase involved in cell wall biosynthesis
MVNKRPVRLAVFDPIVSAGGVRRFTLAMLQSWKNLASPKDFQISLYWPERDNHGEKLILPFDYNPELLSRKFIPPCSSVREAFHWLKTEENEFDLIYFSGLAGIIDPRGLDFAVPTVFTFHDLAHELTQAWGVETPAVRFYSKLLCDFADGIIFSSNFVREKAQEFYSFEQEKAHKVYLTTPLLDESTPNLSKVAEIKKRYRLPETFAFSPGTAMRHKNPLLIIEAIGQLKRKGSRLPLVFIGPLVENMIPGTESASTSRYHKIIQKRIRDLNLKLNEDLFILGHIPDSELASFYTAASLVITASESEAGLNGPILEAMHYQRPTLCSNIPQFAERLGLEDHLVGMFSHKNPVDLGNQIQTFIDNPDRFQDRAQTAKEWVAQRTWDDAAAEYLTIFRQIAARTVRPKNYLLNYFVPSITTPALEGLTTAVDLSIIINGSDRLDHLANCIKRVLQTTPTTRCKYEIVVTHTENITDSDFSQFMKSFDSQGLEVFFMEFSAKVAIAERLNRAAARSRGEVLVFLESASEPHPGWLEAGWSTLKKNPQLGIVGGRLLTPDQLGFHGRITILRLDDSSFPLIPVDPIFLHEEINCSAFQEVFALPESCIFIPKDTFHLLRGFADIKDGLLRTTDLCLKCHNHGKKVGWDPECLITVYQEKQLPEITYDSDAQERRSTDMGFFAVYGKTFARLYFNSLIEKEEEHWTVVSPNIFPEVRFPLTERHISFLMNYYSQIFESLGPIYVHFGGAGDALLLLSTFYDKNPEQIVVSFGNSKELTKVFFSNFPLLKKLIIVPFPPGPIHHQILRKLISHLPNAQGMGITPENGYSEEWVKGIDIFKKYNINRNPQWVSMFKRRKLFNYQVTLAPMGSLKGMVGSKKNQIDPSLWESLVRWLNQRHIVPILLGTPDERAMYPPVGEALDKRSYSFKDQMEFIRGSDLFIGADSWGKTFAALAQVPAIVFQPMRGEDLKEWEDPAEYIFIDPWPEIRLVRTYQDFIKVATHLIENGKRKNQRKTVQVKWEGSQFCHHSLALVNREICLQLLAEGINLSLVPYEPDQFSHLVDPRFKKLKRAMQRKTEKATDIHVRHQWPLQIEPPEEGHWVVIQPWEFGSLPKKWVPILKSQVDEIWVPSKYVREIYLRAGIPPQRVQVIPNGVNSKLFHPQIPKRKLPTSKKFKFLFVGGTIWRKGIDLLLEAYISVFSRKDDVTLVIKDSGGASFYQGQTAQDLIRTIQENCNYPEVLYYSEDLSPTEMGTLYTACNCLVHPYRGEGFGLPIAEAMACGLPVIVTGAGACLDFCQPSNAYLIPAEKVAFAEKRIDHLDTVDFPFIFEPDREILAATMRKIYETPSEAQSVGLKARQDILKNFSWNKAAKMIKERLTSISSLPIRRFNTVLRDQLLAEGEDYFNQGDLSRAKEKFESLLALDPHDLEVLNNLGVIAFQEERLEEAIGNLKQALSIDPTYFDSVDNLSQILLRQGKYQEAVMCFQQALKEKPEEIRLLNGLGCLQGLKTWTDNCIQAE